MSHITTHSKAGEAARRDKLGFPSTEVFQRGEGEGEEEGGGAPIPSQTPGRG